MTSHIQIDSISIDLSSAANTYDHDLSRNSQHFTIRGFVSEVRRKRKDSNTKSSPFISDDETNISTERLCDLPDIVAPRYSSCQYGFGVHGSEISREATSMDITMRSPTTRSREHLPPVSAFCGTKKPLVAPSDTGISSEKCSSYAKRMAQYNHLSKKTYSRLALSGGRATGKNPSSQESGSMYGKPKEVPFSRPSSPSNGLSTPLHRSAKGKQVLPSWYPQGTSRGRVMGPSRIYTERIASAHKKTSKDNGLQTAKRHYAKRTSQTSDNVEGCGIFLKYSSDKEVIPSSHVSATEVDSSKLHKPRDKSASKLNRPRTTTNKGKEVANVPSDVKIPSVEEGKLQLKYNQPDHRAPSTSSAQCIKGGDEICMEITNTTRAPSTTSGHSVPFTERTDLGCSSSDNDDEDEDYMEELEQSGRRLRPKRAPKIFSLRKVMDKEKHQNAELCGKGKSRKRKREKSCTRDVPGITNSATTAGSKRVSSCNISRGNHNMTGEVFESALEPFSPAEKISPLRVKDMGKRTLDVPEIVKKTKKIRTERVDFHLQNSCVKSGGKEGLGKKLRGRKSTDGKEKSRKIWTKKKDSFERKEESPTVSKGVQVGTEEVECEKVKDSSPNCVFHACHNKENMVTENIRDCTASASVQCYGWKKEMGKGKEIFVDEAEAGGAIMLETVATREESSSPPKNDTQSVAHGRVKDFDINVPAEEIPMDIVELMAQNQLERTRDAAVDKNVIIEDPYTGQNLNLCSAANADISPSYSSYGITMKPPTITDLRNGFHHTRPVDSMNQLSENLTETHKSLSQIDYLKDSFSSNARLAECVPIYPDHMIDRLQHYSSARSISPSWGASSMAYKPPTNKTTQVAASSFTRYQGGMSTPSGDSIWPPYKPPIFNQTSVGARVDNQVMLSQGSVPLFGPPANQRCVPLNLDLLNNHPPRMNDFSLTHSSHARVVPGYLTDANNKQKMTDCLPPKAARMVDMSSNEAIPALQLLDLMNQSNRPYACDVNRNGNAEILNRSLYEPSCHHFNKPYWDASNYDLYKSSGGGNSSRLPFYDCSKGTSTSAFVQKPRWHSPVPSNQLVHPSLFVNTVSAHNKNGAGFGDSFNIPSRDHRGMVENSAWTSQGVNYSAHKQQLNSTHKVSRNQQWLNVISKTQQTATIVPPFWSGTEALISKNMPVLSLGNGSVAQCGKQGQLLAPNTEICVVNRNPAEIIDPKEASKFTLGPEDFRLCWITSTQTIPTGRGRG